MRQAAPCRSRAEALAHLVEHRADAVDAACRVKLCRFDVDQGSEVPIR
jgi:hypothetical protein